MKNYGTDFFVFYTIGAATFQAAPMEKVLKYVYISVLCVCKGTELVCILSTSNIYFNLFLS